MVPETECSWILRKNSEAEVRVLFAILGSALTRILAAYAIDLNKRRLYVQCGRMIKGMSALQEITYGQLKAKSF